MGRMGGGWGEEGLHYFCLTDELLGIHFLTGRSEEREKSISFVKLQIQKNNNNPSGNP